MNDEPPSQSELYRLRRVANVQFGPGAGDALLSPGGSAADSGTDGGTARSEDGVDRISVTRTASGRIEQCFAGGERLFTKETNGRFVCSVAGSRRIVSGLAAPRHRVVVGEESVEFVREGRNAFAKFVHTVDPDLRPGDEAVVVHDGEVLGVGRAELAPDAMADFDTGVAVSVRHGAGDS